MAPSVVRLGLVGADARSTETTVALLRHQPRLALCGVFDPCLARAAEEAQKLEVAPSPSLDGLLRQADGLLVADVRWMGVEPVVRAACLHRPTLLFSSVVGSLSPEDVQRLQRFSQLTSTLILPELAHRWARSTLRLRELTATRLGAIEALSLRCRHNSEASHHLLMSLDWCCNVVQSEPRAVQATEEGIAIQFRRHNREGGPVTAQLTFAPDPGDISFPILEANIACRHGRANVRGEEVIEWRTDQRLEQESLASDRTARAVMIDLFGRRLVGGILPVPDPADLVRGQRLLGAFQTSRAEGGVVVELSSTTP